MSSVEAGERLGVVTVLYNSLGVLPSFVASLVAQRMERFLLYAVDNASGDGSADWLAQHPDRRIRLTRNAENAGIAVADNQGIRQALADGCRWILLLNNDTEFGPEFFATLIAGLEGHGADIATPKILVHGSSPPVIWSAGGRFHRWQANRATHDGQGQPDGPEWDRPRRTSYATGCCFLAHAAVFQKIGLLDEKFFVYFDDVDYAFRCRGARMTIWYIPDARLWHKVGSLTGGGASPFGMRYATLGKTCFIRKHYRPPARWFWLGAYQLRMLAAFLRGGYSWSGYLRRQRAFREGLAR